MKKIIPLVVLGLLVLVGGGAAFWQYTVASGLATELAASKEQVAKLSAELEVYNKPGAGGQPAGAVFKQKADQLDAVREAFAGGLVLGELETLDKAAKQPSAERKLGLGALRMLVRGPADPGVSEAYEEALKLMDIESRITATCAAQAGMRAAGKKVELMSECAKRPPPKAGAASAGAAGAPQGPGAPAAGAPAAGAPAPAR